MSKIEQRSKEVEMLREELWNIKSELKIEKEWFKLEERKLKDEVISLWSMNKFQNQQI